MRVVVNVERCKRLGEFLKNLDFPKAQEEPVRYDIPDVAMANLYFAMVAICHQTTPHNGPALQGYVGGKLRKGWDYLRERMIKETEADFAFVSPANLSAMSGARIEAMLHDSEFGSTVTDADGRAKILNDIGLKMQELEIEGVWPLYLRSGGWLASKGSAGLIKMLSEFSTYRADPVQKKTFFFLALMFNQGYWNYQDPENLGTPVDYHEVRGHLRLGTAEILDSELRAKILAGQEVTREDDIDIRRAVFDAIMGVSAISGRTPNDLHYFFWNVFRNCCRRDETHCDGCGKHPSLPERYGALSPKQCVFASNCGSTSLEVKLADHLVNTDLY